MPFIFLLPTLIHHFTRSLQSYLKCQRPCQPAGFALPTGLLDDKVHPFEYNMLGKCHVLYRVKSVGVGIVEEEDKEREKERVGTDIQD